MTRLLSLSQASVGRRRPRRPGFSNSLLPPWESYIVSQKFAHQPRRTWTKTRTSARTSKLFFILPVLSEGEVM